MKKLNFKVSIQATSEHAFDVMLGISSKSTYEEWTAVFNPTSTFEGTWEKGSKMLFVGTNEKGEKGGMVSEIADLTPNSFVSIRHYGLLKGNEEITEGPEVEKWSNGLENYYFEEKNGVTEVTIELDTVAAFEDYMNQTYPKALGKLKELCEK